MLCSFTLQRDLETREETNHNRASYPLIYLCSCLSRTSRLSFARQEHQTLENRALLSYYYDHTALCEKSPTKNPPLVISDSAMNNFIRLTSIHNPHIIPVTSENIKCKLGDEVVITEGDFKGIRGKVARIAGQQRVVVELFDRYLVATAYIPKEAMKNCITSQKI